MDLRSSMQIRQEDNNDNTESGKVPPPPPADGEVVTATKRKNWDPVDTSKVTTSNTTSNVSTTNVQNASQNANNFVGLSNQGATCYLNSLLQSLYNTPEIREMVYRWKYNPEVDPRFVCSIYCY